MPSAQDTKQSQPRTFRQEAVAKEPSQAERERHLVQQTRREWEQLVDDRDDFLTRAVEKLGLGLGLGSL